MEEKKKKKRKKRIKQNLKMQVLIKDVLNLRKRF
jgi:hypothetical protein